MIDRCPRCGTRADAEPFTAHVRPGASRSLRERLDVVRRELGLASAGDALEAAVRAVALDLNVGRGVVSRYAGDPRASHEDREEPMGETEHEGQEQAEQTDAVEEGAAEGAADTTEGGAAAEGDENADAAESEAEAGAESEAEPAAEPTAE